MSTEQKITWTHYNYPPVLRLVHLNINELPSNRILPARLAHWSFIMMVIGFVFNTLYSFSFVFDDVSVWKPFFYSLFTGLVYSMIGGFAFYQCYRCLAINSPSTTKLYIITEAIVKVMVFYIFITCSNSSHGVMCLANDLTIFGYIFTIIESLCYLSSIALSVFAFYKIYHAIFSAAARLKSIRNRTSRK
ncbi:hypothetical protein PCE1_003896 [Barthelona sp. PCE]